MNPKAETVEELQGRRKKLHMGMVKLAREDLGLTLTAACDASSVPPLHHHHLGAQCGRGMPRMTDSARADVGARGILARAALRPATSTGT